MRVQRTFLALGMTLCAGILPAQQSETLADIRQGLAVLSTDMQRLKGELNTTGVPSGGTNGSTLDRVATIEAELARLTGKTEQLEFRLNQIVQDGTNRIGDLEFRLCEIEPGCDLGALGQTTPLGGADNSATAPDTRPTQPQGGPQLAVGEEGDYRRAQEALANGDFRSAADQFATFRTTYPGSPLEPQALLGQGTALESLGDTREAARAYLAAYSGYPDSDVAPMALTRLGIALGALDKIAEACVTLAEVPARYPSAASVTEAQDAMIGLNCS